MRTALALFGLLAVASSTLAQTTIIHAGSLIDGVSSKPRSDVSIIIEGERIAGIEPGFVELESAELIDLSDRTVLPGFIDMHVHLSEELDPPGSYAERFYLNAAEYALRAAGYAEKTLAAGFTTVRDLGARDERSVLAMYALRDAINTGQAVGPRIFAAGKSIATTGGHADPTNGFRYDLRGDPGPAQGVINGADDAFKAVRQRYKDGSDVIKLTATGGVLSLAKSGDNPQFTDEELAAVVVAARDYGYTVAVHAHGAEGMKRAIRAGVDSVEHGTYMDAEAMKLMKRNGTWYVPTISAGKWVADLSQQDDRLPEVVRPKSAAIGPQIQQTFAEAYEEGVKIAFGTDAGVSPHGENAKEFGFMVEAGMPPMEAIKSATIHAATLLRKQEDLGSVEPGKYADIVAVDGDPLADISVLESVDFVMKEGRVYR